MIECWISVGHGQYNWLHECVSMWVSVWMSACLLSLDGKSQLGQTGKDKIQPKRQV